jgi:hypothetical protein
MGQMDIWDSWTNGTDGTDASMCLEIVLMDRINRPVRTRRIDISFRFCDLSGLRRIQGVS